MRHQNYSKGIIVDHTTGERMEFQFNPEEISEDNSSNWSNLTIHGIHHPRLQYTSGNGRSISFSLKLFATEEQGAYRTVKQKVDFLRSFLYPDVSSHSLPSRAPNMAVFSFGNLYPGVVCVISSVNPTYSKLFKENLDPLYAEVDITLIEFHVKAVDYREVRTGRR